MAWSSGRSAFPRSWTRSSIRASVLAWNEVWQCDNAAQNRYFHWRCHYAPWGTILALSWCWRIAPLRALKAAYNLENRSSREAQKTRRVPCHHHHPYGEISMICTFWASPYFCQSILSADLRAVLTARPESAVQGLQKTNFAKVGHPARIGSDPPTDPVWRLDLFLFALRANSEELPAIYGLVALRWLFLLWHCAVLP